MERLREVMLTLYSTRGIWPGCTNNFGINYSIFNGKQVVGGGSEPISSSADEFKEKLAETIAEKWGENTIIYFNINNYYSYSHQKGIGPDHHREQLMGFYKFVQENKPQLNIRPVSVIDVDFTVGTQDFRGKPLEDLTN